MMSTSTIINMESASHAFGLPEAAAPVTTPPQDTSEQPSNQTGEKRRNKLGYHRTSVACGHCRRRKIRCILSSEVPSKCVNCIRLKKDCSFHPVDQAPSDRRSGSRSRARRSSPNDTSVSTTTASTHAPYSSLSGVPINAMARASSISTPGAFYSMAAGPDQAWGGYSQGSSSASDGSVAYVTNTAPSTYDATATWSGVGANMPADSTNGWMNTRAFSFDSDALGLPYGRRPSMMSDYASSVSDASLAASAYEPQAHSVSTYAYAPSSNDFDQWTGFGTASTASDPQIQGQVQSHVYYNC